MSFVDLSEWAVMLVLFKKAINGHCSHPHICLKCLLLVQNIECKLQLLVTTLKRDRAVVQVARAYI